MPINRDHIGNLKAYKKKYMCPDDQLIGTRGNFDSDSGKTLFVSLEKCHDRPDCKPENEIVEFFRGKYLVLLLNHIYFDVGQLKENSIVAESFTYWIPIGSFA